MHGKWTAAAVSLISAAVILSGALPGAEAGKKSGLFYEAYAGQDGSTADGDAQDGSAADADLQSGSTAEEGERGSSSTADEAGPGSSAAEETAGRPERLTDLGDADSGVITLGFAGDINFDENWATTAYMDTQERGILDCISPELVSMMRSYDIFMINNEFTYSTRGEKVAKSYNFRADPSRVDNLEILGTDIVLLANNHVFDYGPDALEDTFETLEKAGIPYVGAGRNIEEAAAPYYFAVNGRKIAYVAASSAESYSAAIATREASEDESGILACYDPERFLEAIREADENADFVVASVHWGLEYDYDYSSAQRELAEEMASAGADAVIGSHTHCLQGINMIGGVPVFYSIGNFWFNDKNLYSCLVELDLSVPESTEKEVTLREARFIPCTQYDLHTDLAEGDEKKEILDFEEGLSGGDISLGGNGEVTAAAKSGGS